MLLTGRRGIALTSRMMGAHNADVHTHVSVGGKVDLNAHTHDGHKGDHGHPAPANDGGPVVCWLYRLAETIIETRITMSRRVVR